MAMQEAASPGALRPGPTGGELTGEILAEILPELRSGAWRLRSCVLTEVQHHHGRRILHCRLTYRDTSSRHPRIAAMVAKIFYRGDRGARSASTLQRLWDAGFRPPARFRVPRLYGYSPERGLLAQGTAPGTVWLECLSGDGRDLRTASARAAEWLVRLHRCPVAAEIVSEEGSPDQVRRHAQDLAGLFPRHAPRLESLGERLAARLDPEGIPLVPSHGDYHPNNVFLAPGVTTVIDFDYFGLREAAFDVGYAMGELLVMAHYKQRDLTPGARAALAFWERYRVDGRAPWERVAAHVARTLLKTMHYGLFAMHGDRPGELRLWPTLMDEWLDSEGPALLAHPAGRLFQILGPGDRRRAEAVRRKGDRIGEAAA